MQRIVNNSTELSRALKFSRYDEIEINNRLIVKRYHENRELINAINFGEAPY